MRWALVAGSNGPTDLGPLKYARSDAEKIGAVFASPTCGFEVIMPESESTASFVRQQLLATADNLREEDTFICYFAGHGLTHRGSLVLFLDDTEPDRLLSTGLFVSEITHALKYCKARSKLLILDCCRAGAAVADMLGYPDVAWVPRRDTEEVVSNNYVALMASGRLEKTRELDELQGGFLTWGIRSAFTDRFVEADKDRDNKISVHDLKLWLDECTDEHNREHSQPDERVPRPELFQQLKDEFFFTVGEPVEVVGDLQKQILDFVLVQIRHLRRPITQQEIEDHVHQRHPHVNTAEIFYRLETLHLAGFLYKWEVRKEGPWARHVYGVSPAYARRIEKLTPGGGQSIHTGPLSQQLG